MTETSAPKKTRKQIAEFGAEVKKISAKHSTLLEVVAHKLESMVREHKYVDAGTHAADAIGCSRVTLQRAIQKLEEDGLAKRFYVSMPQKNTNLMTTLVILAPADSKYADVIANRDKYHKITTVPETRQEQLNRRERAKVLKSATYGLSLEEKIEKINQSDYPETEKRSLRAIAKSEARAMQVKEATGLKMKGYSNVAIGKTMGLSESTVRRLLQTFEERDAKVQKLMAAAQEALEDAREDILKYFTAIPEFQEIFGDGLGDKYILRIHTVERAVSIIPSRKRVEFTLKFWAQNQVTD